MFLARMFQRSLAWVALCAVLCSVALPMLERHAMGAADDAACMPVAGAGGVAVHEVGAPNAGGALPDHCVFCHLQRAVSGAFASDVTAVAQLSETRSPLFAADRTPLTGVWAAPSSRGPPASL